eukprot:CAMPEP_0182908804 /NCGR_PEP_ID=MMETSP0034_2-20130328/35400_1 /TAXON_ID=156128 /ORGANISM="Nephroselmis pyriformis, Strain CCMP717" /LENGTH=279 /DNA_ID=CAMNT_0025045001 /DNA_START=11 /DNA_END=850 /DNA_ORIENTATION=+
MMVAHGGLASPHCRLGGSPIVRSARSATSSFHGAGLARVPPASARTARARFPGPARAAIETQEGEADVSEPAPAGSKWKRAACFKATKTQSREIQELGRPLADYMALPASQYSVLDADQIVRVDDETFKCVVGEIKIFNLEVEPTVTVSVAVDPEGKGCTIQLLEVDLGSSEAGQAINNKFNAYMRNEVVLAESGIQSSILLQVDAEVPRLFPMPARAVSKIGSGIMQGVINVAVPRFLQQLEADYANWAEGDDSREAVSTGSGALGSLDMEGSVDMDE